MSEKDTCVSYGYTLYKEYGFSTCMFIWFRDIRA